MNQLMKTLVPLTAQLKREGLKIVTAESCTGGMIAEALTRLPGSTGWFDRGFVTYTNEAKQEMLGVKAEVFLTDGAVSQACVEQMAQGALQQAHAQVAVAVSGIAGPTGGTDAKPVGTVWMAWARQSASGEVVVKSERFLFKGDRTAVRQQSTLAALIGVKKLLA